MADYLPLFKPGQTVTFTASAEVLGGQAVEVTGDRSVGPAAALSGQWPIARELYIFTDGAPSGAVKEFVDYLLAPDKGQKNVLEVGYVPLGK